MPCSEEEDECLKEPVRVLASLDQGTSSTRFVVFDVCGRVVSMAQKEHAQHHPEPGWVEHDLAEVWSNCEWCIEEGLRKVPYEKFEVAALGVTNQRETLCVFDQEGTPRRRTISWNDARTDLVANEVKARRGHRNEATAYRKTGLPTASYFTATKLKWLRDHEPGLFDCGYRFSTVDSFLVAKLTGHFKTDVTNASRTLLFDLNTLDWDTQLLGDWGFSMSSKTKTAKNENNKITTAEKTTKTKKTEEVWLAEVEPSVGGDFGVVTAGPLKGVRVSAVLGDQHAAAFGQFCFRRGDVKATFGTGAFVLMNTAETPVFLPGLLTTPLYQIKGRAPVFAMEGAIAVAGTALQWLRDNLDFADSADQLANMAATDNGGVYFVPALNGLFAPHWDATARGAVLGLTTYADKGHLVRAALEATAFQLDDLLRAFDNPPSQVYVDGGMAKNDSLLQFVADILDLEVLRPRNLETTAAGAAFAAGLAAGVYADLDDLIKTAKQHNDKTRFAPSLSPERRLSLRATWAAAIQRSRGWLQSQQEQQGNHHPVAKKVTKVALVVAVHFLVLAAFKLRRGGAAFSSSK